MSPPLFETERLRCRRWTSADLPAIFATYSDPDGVRFVGDGTPITLQQCEEWLQVTERNYKTRGYGMFALDSRGSGETVGFCGLVHPGGQAEPEIKYAFLRHVWGLGLASEAVPALLTYGHNELKLPKIIATVAAGNLASQRVLAKAGAAQASERRNDDGTTTLIYQWPARSVA